MKKTLLLWAAMALTATGLRGQMISIPFAGTNTLTPPWWTTTLTNATGISPWEAWQAVNTNFTTLQGEVTYVQGEFDAAVSTGIPAMITSALGSSGFAFQTYAQAVSNNVVGVQAFAAGVSNNVVAEHTFAAGVSNNMMSEHTFATGVSNNVTAATNALAATIAGWGYLTGNQTVMLSGDVSGSGATAIAATVTNIQPPGGGSPGQPLTKTATGVGFGSINASAVAGLTDADTNGVIQSGTFVAASTNWLYTSGATTNILPWVLTNYAGCTYTATSGVPTILWSTDSGATWNAGGDSLVTNVAIKLAVFAGGGWGPSYVTNILNGDVGLTNLVAYGLSRSDLYGRTNQVIGQRLSVGTPVYATDAVPKSYADALAGQVGQLNAGQDGQLNGYGLHLDSAWNLFSSSSNNALQAVFLGKVGWGMTYTLPTALTNSVIASVTQRTNATVKVLTNGLASAPVLKITHYLQPLNWTYLNITPTITGTNYVFSFTNQYTDCAFVAPVMLSTNPPIFSVSGNLTSGIIQATNGMSSAATNTYAMTSTGWTNLSAITVRVVGLTGTSIVQSNAAGTASITRGTITAPTDALLQPYECVVGSSLAAQKIIAW